MELIKEKAVTLMSICFETPGCFELDLDSGEPRKTCVFARLSQDGYDSASFASADERGVPSLYYIYRLVYPGRGKQPLNKMQPDCRKLAPIVEKSKFRISANLAHNVINKDGGNASSSWKGVSTLKWISAPPIC